MIIGDTTMEEIWKDIPGYEGQYQVSNLGRVKSLPRNVPGKNGSIRHLPGKLLSPADNDSDGYKFVMLTKNSKSTHMLVHRLVATAFIPNPENKPQVNHKDCIPSNNELSNLEWSTQSENMVHASNNSTASKKKLAKMLAFSNRCTSISVMCVETGEVFSSCNQASKVFRVDDDTIKRLADTGDLGKCGYHFKYCE